MSGSSSSEARAYTFDWRADEHAGVTSLLVREQFGSGIRRVMKWGVVIILVLGAVVAMATAIAGSLAEAMPLGALVIAVAALVLAFGRLAGWIQAWQLKRHDPNVAHPITHSLDESGYHVSTRTTDLDIKWGGVHKVRETPELFMFYYSSRLAYYLPKRALPNPEEVAELRAWVRAQLPPEVAYVES
jgi:hypothetical protein